MVSHVYVLVWDILAGSVVEAIMIRAVRASGDTPKATRSRAVQCLRQGVVQRSAVQCSTAQCNVVQCLRSDDAAGQRRRGSGQATGCDTDALTWGLR